MYLPTEEHLICVLAHRDSQGIFNVGTSVLDYHELAHSFEDLRTAYFLDESRVDKLPIGIFKRRFTQNALEALRVQHGYAGVTWFWSSAWVCNSSLLFTLDCLHAHSVVVIVPGVGINSCIIDLLLLRIIQLAICFVEHPLC